MIMLVLSSLSRSGVDLLVSKVSFNEPLRNGSSLTLNACLIMVAG